MQHLVEPVLLALLAIAPDGKRRFSNEEIRHVIPLLVLELGVPMDGLSDAAKRVLADFAARAGIHAGMTGEEQISAFLGLYQREPPSARVLEEIRRVLQRLTRGDAQAESASFLGEGRPTSILGGGMRPAGTVSGGLGARLGLGDLLPKKSTPK